jgi:membrane protein implicated in regulation of membrane protease activity
MRREGPWWVWPVVFVVIVGLAALLDVNRDLGVKVLYAVLAVVLMWRFVPRRKPGEDAFPRRVRLAVLAGMLVFAAGALVLGALDLFGAHAVLLNGIILAAVAVPVAWLTHRSVSDRASAALD